MNRFEYFLKAANYHGVNRAYTKKHWVISLLAVTFETESVYMENPYPYRLLRKEDGFYFIDLEKNGEHTKLTDNRPLDKPLFTPNSAFKLKAGDLKNLHRDIDSTFGDVLFNLIVLIYAFGDKIDFVAGKVDARKLEDQIEKRLVDNPTGEELDVDTKSIYVREYLNFGKAMMQLQGYNYLMVPSASPKSLTTDPRIPELREKLLNDNKDRLHDPAVIAGIEKELVAMDRLWVDDDGKDFYIENKSYDNARKKMLLIHGLERPFTDTDEAVLISKPLSDGMDIKNMQAYANSIREGSFNRGNETMLGGVEAKRAFRNYQNSFITKDDCGTRLGLVTKITSSNAKLHIGVSRQTSMGPELITEENCQALVGTVQVIRSPMLCNNSHTDYCAVCMGSKMSENPDALGAAAAGVGSDFLSAFMKKMHVANLKTVRYDMAECLS